MQTLKLSSETSMYYLTDHNNHTNSTLSKDIKNYSTRTRKILSQLKRIILVDQSTWPTPQLIPIIFLRMSTVVEK